MKKMIMHMALLAVLVLTALVPAPASASVVTDGLQERVKALDKRYWLDQSLAEAAELAAEAERCGLHDVELMALTVPLKYHYYHKASLDVLESNMKPLMHKALKYGSQEYYYMAVSYKNTYLINRNRYEEALNYQDEQMTFARQHGHSYGVVQCHVSLGNMYRMRLQLVEAISEYSKAIEGYRKYKIDHDCGQCYERITECYMIAGQFAKAVEVADSGLVATRSTISYHGMLGLKAFSLFMRGDDAGFVKTYAEYLGMGRVATSINRDLPSLLKVVNNIYEGKYSMVEDELAKKPDEGFWQYVKIALCKRQKMYQAAIDRMQALNNELYGTKRADNTLTWARMSVEIGNNMKRIEAQRVENENSQLDIERTNLELKQHELQLRRLENEERMSLIDAENNRLTYNNLKMVSAQLRDSLSRQNIRREAVEKVQHDRNVMYMMALAVAVVVMVLVYLLLKRINHLSQRLKDTNDHLKVNMQKQEVANQRAQESDHQKTVFIQNISHELRTPLNAIVGFSQVLTDMGDQLSEQEKNDISHQVAASSKQLSTLINDILDLTKLESGKMPIAHSEVYVNALCRDSLDLTRRHAAKGVQLKFESTLPDDFVMMSDGTRISQVLVNMLSNAGKNTSQGSITLQADLNNTGDVVCFAVTDTGVGVPEEKREEIFQLFHKLDTFKQGTGLGLGLCSAIAKRLGGNIYLDPQYTGGARFCFNVPLNGK